MTSCLLHSLASIFDRLEGCLFEFKCLFEHYFIISHSGLWTIIIYLDEGSIFIQGQGKKLLSRVQSEK